MMVEAVALQLALLGYLLAALGAAAPLFASMAGPTAIGRIELRVAARAVAAPALGIALVLHTLALAARWQTHGHGPFTTMHEILSSNLWSLALVFALSAAAVRDVRQAFGAAAPVLLLLAAWLAASNPGPGHLPPTYATPLLYIHTLMGKLFLGLLLVAVALAATAAWRSSRWQPAPMRAGPNIRHLDEGAHRFAAFAFVFQTLMLTAGAVWAQDAWGRYWAWDPLESWAFATWVALALALHARATLRPAPALFAVWLAGVFVLAFITFFGVPFISTSPHKGAV